MGLDLLNPESLVKIGRLVRQKRESLGLTQQVLASKSGYEDRTVRNVEQGNRTRLKTLQDICEAVGLPPNDYEISNHIIARDQYGAYNFKHYADYVGIYFGFRRGLTVQTNFLRTVYEMQWNGTKACLEFFEDQKYTATDGTKVDYSQHGDIYINNDKGLLHLLTSDSGAIRLITLSKFRRGGKILEGVVLTQLQQSHYYSPAVSPIYLEKVDGVASRSELASSMGPISPTDELYGTVAGYIAEVEREVAYFPPVSSLDPKVTRLSTRLSKPRS